jgi:site-specific DNA-methyltransferase (adenine-specific)
MTAPKRAGPAVPGDYQIFPAHSPDEFAALKESIWSRGVLVPIVVDQHGTIIDGHHRKRAYDELIGEGAKLPPYERKVVRFANVDDRLSWAVSLNERRRQLSPEQRKKVARTLRQRGWSLRRIGEELGAGPSTIKRDLTGVPGGTPARVTGKDGKRYAAIRPPAVSTFSDKDEKRAVDLMGELGDDLPRRETTVGRLEKFAKKRRVFPSAPPDGSSHKGPRWRLDCADMRKWKVRANSVDLIVTDPPYEAAGIPLYRDLSAFAARTLKPGGLLFAYAGNLFLDQIFDALRSELNYVVAIIFCRPPGSRRSTRSRWTANSGQCSYFPRAGTSQRSG